MPNPSELQRFDESTGPKWHFPRGVAYMGGEYPRESWHGKAGKPPAPPGWMPGWLVVAVWTVCLATFPLYLAWWRFYGSPDE